MEPPKALENPVDKIVEHDFARKRTLEAYCLRLGERPNFAYNCEILQIAKKIINMNNPLLEEFSTPYQSVPFSQIKNEHYLPAFLFYMEQSEKEIEEIVKNPHAPTFENTVEALAYSGRGFSTVSDIFFNLNSAETSDTLQNIAKELSPILSDYYSRLSQNEALFSRIKKIYGSKDINTLDSEQKTLLENTYKSFVRNGALLSESDKEKLKKIDKELSLLSLEFGENILASTNDYYKHITHASLLEGIPDQILSQYAQAAKERNLEGYVVTLQHPSYVPFITYADNRDLRKELYLANGKKSYDGGKWDNREVIKKIVKLRAEKANLLGYRDYAGYILEERMAKSPDKVTHFLHQLLEKATPHAHGEYKELSDLGKRLGIDRIEAYDHLYLAEKLKREKLDLDEQALKPYFSLENVQKAVFLLAEKLFNLKFSEIKNIDIYHPEVKTYEISEDGKYKAILYVDYFPRKGKRAGAWMTKFRSQYKERGKDHRPHISVVCNFPKPTAETPSLLNFREVTTLFHEFGHAIHGILADTRYPSLSGTSVKWDFVELPSQFLENYAYESEFLQTFARHYLTQEVLPKEKIQKLSQGRNFMEGYQTLRQLGFGLLDLAYHTENNGLKDIKDFENLHTKGTSLYPSHPEVAISPSLSHIFQGGYAAGYYSYKWAEVLEADAFQYFKEQGIFSPEVAQKYKKLLAAGGTQDPMELYTSFRGRAPKVESLINRAFGHIVEK